MKTLGNILWHFPFFGFVSAIVVYLLGLSRLDFPNPFRIENYFYFAAAGVLMLGALALLLLGRSGIASHMSFWSLTPLIVGV